MSCSVWVPDLAELHECASAWLSEELVALGAEDAGATAQAGSSRSDERRRAGSGRRAGRPASIRALGRPVEGIAIVNDAPRPGALSTQMRPPWPSTIDLLIASPRPLPGIPS